MEQMYEARARGCMPDQPKPAKHRWAKGIGKPRTSQAKQGEVVALAMAGQSNRGIARVTGLNRETVARILSQEEFAHLAQSYRAQVMDLMPKVMAGLDYLIKKKDRQTILAILFGLKILARGHELEMMPQKRERTYASAMVEYHFLYGKWPTLEEAKEFDKTIKVELLTKHGAKPEPEN